jgi:hypothetical protein
MKTLSYVILALALLALVIAPVAADSVPLLRADLDDDKDVETVMPMLDPGPEGKRPLYRAADTDKDGDLDDIETRGIPYVLCGLDNDGAPEAVIYDRELGSAWAAAPLGSNSDQPAMLFVRGQIVGCETSPNAEEEVLIVNDAAYAGTADIDGDGSEDIKWLKHPSLTSASPSTH